MNHLGVLLTPLLPVVALLHDYFNYMNSDPTVLTVVTELQINPDQI